MPADRPIDPAAFASDWRRRLRLESGINATGAIADQVIEAGDRALAMNHESSAPAGIVAERPAPAPTPSFLGERIEVIAADICDAIVDACDAQLPHALIRALTYASAEIRLAAREAERAQRAAESSKEVTP